MAASHATPPGPSPALTPPRAPTRPREEEYDGIEYGGVPRLGVVFFCGGVVGTIAGAWLMPLEQRHHCATGTATGACQRPISLWLRISGAATSAGDEVAALGELDV